MKKKDEREGFSSETSPFNTSFNASDEALFSLSLTVM
jgi:hypothetical protein